MKLLTYEEAERTGKLGSEELRMANHVRFACALDSNEGRLEFFDMVADLHGQDYANRLREQAREYWKFKKGRG